MGLTIKDLILGTAQFGLDYGVSNESGKTDQDEVKRILNMAITNDIQYLDTAPVYGDSEQVLSANVGNRFKVNTKLKPLTSDGVESVLNALKSSIYLFGGSLWGVTVHNIKDLESTDYVKVIDTLNSYKKNNVIKNIGISVYRPEDIEMALYYIKPDFVQLPFNIYDQRFKDLPVIEKIRKFGCEIHVRSVFLQGLLLMNKDTIKNELGNILTNHDYLADYAAASKLTVYELCLKWVFQQKWIDKLVVGVNDLSQFNTLIETISYQNSHCINLSEFSSSNPLIINPANW